MNKVKITEEQIENWIGTDVSEDDYLELLVEIINGDYKIATFRKDVLDFYKTVGQ